MLARLDTQGTLKANSLSCIRGGRVLFEGISFNLNPRDGLIIYGPNGSGKTSLLRIIAGFLSPTSGTLTWLGEEAKDPFRLIPGFAHYLGHAHALKPFLTVEENLKLWQADTSFDIALGLEKTGMSDFQDFPVKFLSEGQKKRVNLTRFLLTPQPIWVMDEPVAGLDTEGQEILANLIQTHLIEGGIFIGATHQTLELKGLKTLTLGGGKS